MYDRDVSPAMTPSRPGEYGRVSAGAAARSLMPTMVARAGPTVTRRARAPSAVALDRAKDEADEDGADGGEDERPDEPLDPAEAHEAGEPAADDPAHDPDDHRREAAGHRARADEPARHAARDEADEDPAEQSEVHDLECAMGPEGGPSGGQPARNASTSVSSATGWLWCAACRAP